MSNKWSRRTLLTATGAGLVAGMGPPLSGATDEDKREELYIGVEDGMTTAEVEDYLEESSDYPEGTELIDHIEPIDVAHISRPVRPSTLSEDEKMASIEQDTRVRYAEPEPEAVIPDPPESEVPPETADDELASDVLTDADPDSAERFEPNDPMLADQWDVEAMNLPEAWAQTTGSTDTVVAVLDTGVELDHPNLRDQFGDNKGNSPGPNNNSSHGTNSAGCAAATINNEIGVAGTSDSRLRSYDVWSIGMSRAIVDAVDDGADLLTMSMGTGGGEYSNSVADAAQYAYENDVVFLTSAGNSGDDGLTFPARMDEVIAVGASTEWEAIAGFSSKGPELDIAAPGNSVPTTTLDGEHTTGYGGTSAACPEAAGVVALGLSKNPDLTPDEVKETLKKTASDLGEPEDAQGAGQVDAVAFLEEVTGGSAPEPPTAALEVTPEGPTAGETVTFDAGESDAPDGEIEEYEWTFGDGESATGEEVEHSYTDDGEYEVTLTVTDDNEQTGDTSETVTVDPLERPPSSTVDPEVFDAVVEQNEPTTELTDDDMDAAIAAYHSGETINGVELRFDDVVGLIRWHNR